MLYAEKEATYFSTARSEILELLPKFSKRVMEIGCGSGQTLEMLKSLNLCQETVGLELFENAAEQAKSRVDKVYCLDVERDSLPEDIGRFNLILLLDVLEHLVDPWDFLNRLKEKYLSEQGVIIVSLPNAQHFSFVGPLLLGDIEYVERGVRDKTHLRFFTKKSGARMLVDAGFSVEKIHATSLGLNLNSGRLNLLTFGFFSQFLASQYIYSAVSNK
jgi:2-polyprenyl-3-methyl-5-hydroxy-6-metoxy-1,4-benzoquinol methylase